MAVIKADHGDLVGNTHPLLKQQPNQPRSNFVIVAHQSSAVVQYICGLLPKDIVREEQRLGFGIVPEHTLILQRQAQIPKCVGVSGIALQSLQVVIFKNAGNGTVPLFIQVLHQLAAAVVVVVQHGQTAGELRIDAVHKDHGHALINQLVVEVQVGIGQSGLGSLYQNAVGQVSVQQGLENTALIGYLVLGGIESGGAVVGGQDGFNLPKNGGKNNEKETACPDPCLGHVRCPGRLRQHPPSGDASSPAPSGTTPAEGGSGDVITVGFAQVGHESDWRTASTKSAQDVFSAENGYELSFVDCDNDSAKQLEAVRNFIQQGLDYIIIDPIVATGWDAVLTECEAAGAMTAMDNAGVTYGVGGDVILVSFDANKPYVQMVMDGKINANFECNPMAAPTVAEIIQQLEAGETPEKEIYVTESWFAAEDNVATITVNGEEQPMIYVTQEVLDARPY